MKRGNNYILENISKLNTFIHMTKSNEFLSIYLEKILNKKSKSIKFINDFDYVSLDLLYTSLQIMNSSNKVSLDDYKKIDKKELDYYLNKATGIGFFRNQVPSIKNAEVLIDYLRMALATGKYICNNNNTIKFSNGLVVDSDWLVEFAFFLVTSFNNNVNLSVDSLTYSFKSVVLPLYDGNIKKYIKDIKLYEYNVSRKDEKKLSYQSVKYLIDVFKDVLEYDFKKLQKINSVLAKEGFTLSINKNSIVFTKDDRDKIEKLLNESEGNDEVVSEFIKDTLNCYNTKANRSRNRLIENYEILRGLVKAYKCNYTLDECRKLFSIGERADELQMALAISNFYINYIYDKDNLNEYFNYGLLKLNDLKPSIIDYETMEYKNIINELSRLNKKVVLENRKINRYLETSRLAGRNVKAMEENSAALAKHCRELERLVKEIKGLREELAIAKDENRHESNMNRTKITYIERAIIEGKYEFDKDSCLLTFDGYSKKDYHHTFHMDITLNDFIECLLSDYNRNIRINFYQI